MSATFQRKFLDMSTKHVTISYSLTPNLFQRIKNEKATGMRIAKTKKVVLQMELDSESSASSWGCEQLMTK